MYFFIISLHKFFVATDSNPVDMQTYELCSDMIDVVIDVSCIYGLRGSKGDVLAYDADSASVIKLSNNYVLYLREVNKYLALVCLMRSDSFTRSGLVEYNFACFKKAIAQLFEAKAKLKQEHSNKDNSSASTAATSVATTSTSVQPPSTTASTATGQIKKTTTKR